MEMKRDRIIISRKALLSVKKIYEELLKKKVSLETAKRIRDGIINKCKSLKDFAGYSKEPYLEGDYRSVTQWSYIIIYRLTDKEVRVLNVIHGSQHPDKRKDI